MPEEMDYIYMISTLESLHDEYRCTDCNSSSEMCRCEDSEESF